MADSCAVSYVRRAGLSLLFAFAGCDQSATEHSISPLSSPALAMPAPPPPPPPPAAAPPAETPPALPRLPAPPEFFAGTFHLQDDILRTLVRARPLEFRPVGMTKTVFRTGLDAPFRAAFKAATRIRPFGAVNEVAAYRLARRLGLSNVPPAVLRRVSKQDLYAMLDAAYRERWPMIQSRLAIDESGMVEVAAIYWIEDLRDLGLEAPRETERALAWLKLDSEIPPPQLTLATQLSTLLAFDYLIGNWDRWSGGNLKGDGEGENLYMRDHDSSFAGRLNETLQRRILEPMQRTQRYSRSFVQAVRALDRESFAEELQQDPLLAGRVRATTHAGALRPTVDLRAFDQLFDRRATFLSHVDTLIEEYGEERVLSLP